jgi:hypothetical protein
MFPPLIEGGCACGGERSSEDNMEKPRVINGASGAQIISDRCCEQYKKSQPRFDQFAEVGKETMA